MKVAIVLQETYAHTRSVLGYVHLKEGANTLAVINTMYSLEEPSDPVHSKSAVDGTTYILEKLFDPISLSRMPCIIVRTVEEGYNILSKCNQSHM